MMNPEDTEARTPKQIITQRFPLLLMGFVLALAYIYIGYTMQEMKLREDRLKKEYTRLRGADVVTHTEMFNATGKGNLEALIKKYRLNIITEKITPIPVPRHENGR